MSVADQADRLRGEEADLVARVGAGGDVGPPVAELYRRYGKRLFRFGVLALSDNGLAEEMVQETFVRLWRTASRFDASKSSVGTYLFVIARSVAADIRKRPSSRPLLAGRRRPRAAGARHCRPDRRRHGYPRSDGVHQRRPRPGAPSSLTAKASPRARSPNGSGYRWERSRPGCSTAYGLCGSL